LTVAERRALIDPADPALPVVRQCLIARLARSSYYHGPSGLSEEDHMLLRRIDELFTRHPYFGTRRLRFMLRRQ